MSLVAGSYEKFIWGLTLKPQSQSLTPLFSYPSHLSSIKTVAISGSVVASGGDDDTIHLYDLSAASSLGSLHQHSASVTALSFYAPPNLPFPRNLISADAAGSLAIFDADGFVHLTTLSVHRNAAINDLALHPSGERALTVARDNCLAVVNLVRGRRNCCLRLDKEATLVKFNASGDHFFMAAKEKVSVHQTEDARILFELECSKPVLCAAPARNGLLYTGGEDKSMTAWDIKTGKVAYCLEDAHTSRVKGIVVLTDTDGSTGDDDPYLVASGSSDGSIRVWDVRMVAREKPLAEYNTRSRLTCLAGTSLRFRRQKPQDGSKSKTVKRQRLEAGKNAKADDETKEG
ncbi:p21-activated protein kinase-interacting protein 1 [Vigna radiata var. radiata]|uniref:P21-activated protein kinase-interacting protein 1 n=1 Tax=Vigna radiata var. radiata TaxID=3916 RepID=A0A1S3U2K7_VIGRR|nr:p21-activated protein kinase-interacting protein 1 [Vigna radiata var. radiata]